MTAIAKKLDARMNRWAPETAKKVERLVAEIIELADHDALDLVRSRQVEQEVCGQAYRWPPSRVRSGWPTSGSPLKRALLLSFPKTTRKHLEHS